MLKPRRVRNIVRSRQSVAECKMLISKTAGRELNRLTLTVFKRNPPIPSPDEQARAKELKAVRDNYEEEALRHMRVAKISPDVVVCLGKKKEYSEEEILI